MNGVENCFSFIIGKATQSVSRRARELLAPFGITPAQYAVLSAVYDSYPVPVSDLVERLQIDTATLTGVVDRLEANGLIKRTAHSTDRRINLLTPTQKGKRGIRSMDESMDLLNSEIAELLGVDKKAVIKGLKKLNFKDNGS